MKLSEKDLYKVFSLVCEGNINNMRERMVDGGDDCGSSNRCRVTGHLGWRPGATRHSAWPRQPRVLETQGCLTPGPGIIIHRSLLNSNNSHDCSINNFIKVQQSIEIVESFFFIKVVIDYHQIFIW